MTRKKKGQFPAKWDPFMNEMASFKKSIDQAFDSFFKHPLLAKMPSVFKGAFGVWRPAIDVYETEREVVVKASVPGCDKKAIKVDVKNNLLTITGQRKEEKEIKKKNFYHKEQTMGAFQRSITLPQNINPEKAKATCENGVLKIVFPRTKSPGGKGKNIEIE
ncbi:MAG: Hsp20/alpha crystallin family protein [Candidatus Omnitrophota bacterium]|nr:MAG: Hsp20/alpha crystallin family protein [Candidatus Omnitrophota bacterium]